MIPLAFITEWSQHVPWQSNEQVEQDLLICRALVEIFTDPWLCERLAFRGGTALHKLYLNPQSLYSEDIDFMQIKAGSFGEIADRIRERLEFLGEPSRKPKQHNFTLIYKFQSEASPDIMLKLKVETNTREHFSILGYDYYPFEVQSQWLNGKCEITTYKFEELVATKLRALYQRRKGRDLFDLYKVLLDVPDLDKAKVILCFKKYIEASPTKDVFIANLETKMKNASFLGDTTALLRSEIQYDPKKAYDMVKKEFLDLL